MRRPLVALAMTAATLQPLTESFAEGVADESMRSAPEASLVPHKGHVTLCEDTHSRFVVVHDLTQERIVLPGRGWELVFDEGGFGCLTSTESGDLKLLEDELRMQVYKDDAGHLQIVERRGAAVRQWSLTDRFRQYMTGEVGWSYQPSHHFSLQFCQLAMTRGGCRYFFQVGAVYKQLGLTSYKNCASKWIYESAPVWKKALASYGIKEVMLHSPAGELVSTALNSVTHFLPWIGLSSIGLLYILVRMASPVPQRGGLAKQASRAQCEAILDGLLASIAGDIGPLTEWKLPVVFMFGWVCSWPVPPAHSADMRLPVTSDALVDLSEWHVAAARPAFRAHSPAGKWFKLIADLGKQCSLKTFLLRVGHADPTFRADGLFAQLLVSITKRIEEFAAHKMSGQTCVADTQLSVYLHEPGDSVQTPRDVDMLLIRHVESCKQSIGRPLFVGLTADKAWVKGLNLMNGVLVLPSNIACVCPPQVVVRALMAGAWGSWQA